jgi:hypothetical protein
MRLHNVQEMAIAHFTVHPHVGLDDIGVIAFLAIATIIALVEMLAD